MSPLHTLLVEWVKGKIPKDLSPGEDIHLYKDGEPGPGGTVGNRKINTNIELKKVGTPSKTVSPKERTPGNRHFSVSNVKTVKTKLVGDKLTDHHGIPIEKLRQQFDIERTPKAAR